MSLTQYYTATSLDGFIADPDNSLGWLFTRKREDDGPLNYEAFVAANEPKKVRKRASRPSTTVTLPAPGQPRRTRPKGDPSSARPLVAVPGADP